VSSDSIFWYEAGICQIPEQSLCFELVRSDDGGATWLRADHGLTGGSGSFTPIWTSEDSAETLYASYSYPGLHPAVALFVTHNAGADWQPVKFFPPNAGANTFTTQGPSILDAYPANIIYDELIGPKGTSLHNVVESTGTSAWSTLPPLPVSGADKSHDGIAQVLGVTSGGELLVLGPSPSSADSTQQGTISQPSWLWAWNPTAGRWESAPLALPVIPEGATISASGPVAGAEGTSGSWLWLVSPSASGTQLNRAFLL
jgi:hypothetical protein